MNFATVATPLRLEGEAAYAASKAAVVSLTEVTAREFADFKVTVNAVGITPVETDLTARSLDGSGVARPQPWGAGLVPRSGVSPAQWT